MKIMTMELYNEWTKEEGIPLTKEICLICGRRTEACRFCHKENNQLERLSERTPKR